MDSQHLRCLGSKSQTFWHWRAFFGWFFDSLIFLVLLNKLKKGQNAPIKSEHRKGRRRKHSNQLRLHSAGASVQQLMPFSGCGTKPFQKHENQDRRWMDMKFENPCESTQPLTCPSNIHQHDVRTIYILQLPSFLASASSAWFWLKTKWLNMLLTAQPQIISSLYNLWTFIPWFSFGFLDFACLLFRFNLGCFGFCFWFFDHESVESSKSLHCLNTRSFAPKSQRHGVFLECGRMLFRCRMQTFIFVAVVFRISIWFVISEPSFSMWQVMLHARA